MCSGNVACRLLGVTKKMVSIAKILTEARRLQIRNNRLADHERHQATETFGPPTFIRPKKGQMEARSEYPVLSRKLVGSRNAASGEHHVPQLRSKFYKEPNLTAIDTTVIRPAGPRHVIECMGYRKPAPSLDCPEVKDFLMLEDKYVMEDEIWFALTPITRFWNSNAAYEAKRIVTKNRFDCLLVIGICRDSTSFNLHVLNDYCPVPTHEPWRLAEHTLNELLESNDWVGIVDGLQPDRAHLAIGRVFHHNYRLLQSPGSGLEYQGIIVVGTYVSHHNLKLLDKIDRVILHQDVTTMLEYIINKPLRIS
ncbi:hypothetical protein LZ30DRAFT_811328 [Colletotrichum cereale]|nr:hypothetical protein LZ30DRAFT_811328 [Colletotrichum cereale]